MRLVKSPLPVWGSLATRGGRLPAPLGCPKNEAKSAPNFFVRYYVVQDGGSEADGGDVEERREVMAKRKPNPRRVLRVCTQPDLAALIAELQSPDLVWCNARTTNYSRAVVPYENVSIDTREHSYSLSSKYRLDYTPLATVLMPMLGEGGAECMRRFLKAC